MASLRDVGQSLKEAREAQGLPLADVAARTRITVRHLLAIEEGNEADLPETFYIRGFLKKYAESVGLSPKEVADAYRTAPLPTLTPPSRASAVAPVLYYLLVGVMVAGVLYLAWYFQPKLSVVAELPASPRPHAKASPGTPVAEHAASGAAKASPATKASGSPATGSPQPAASQAAAASGAASPQPSGKTITVELTIDERSWVEVKVDGHGAFEGLLAAKSHRSFKGHSVNVSAGNAGGVHLTIDGHDKGHLGERGVVVEKTFKP